MQSCTGPVQVCAGKGIQLSFEYELTDTGLPFLMMGASYRVAMNSEAWYLKQQYLLDYFQLLCRTVLTC